MPHKKWTKKTDRKEIFKGSGNQTPFYQLNKARLFTLYSDRLDPEG